MIHIADYSVKTYRVLPKLDYLEQISLSHGSHEKET